MNSLTSPNPAGRHWPRWLLATAIILAGTICPFLFAEDRGPQLLLNTLLLALGAATIAIPVSLLLALLIAKTDVPLRPIFVGVLGLMLFLPLYWQAAAWHAGFGSLGWFTPAGATPLVSGWWGTIWVHAVASIPAAMFIISLGLRRIEPELEELGLLSGTPLQVLWHITLPQSLPAIGLATLWTAVTTAGEITVTGLFRVSTYADELYSAMSGTGDYMLTTSLILPGVFLLAWLIGAAIFLAIGMRPSERPLTFRAAHFFALNQWRWAAAIIVGVVLFFLIGIPILSLLIQADPAWRGGWSLMRVENNLAESPARFSRELGWTLLIGAFAAVIAIGVSIVACWPARRGGRWACLPGGLIVLAWVIPGPLLALFLITVMNDPRLPWLNLLYDRSIVAPVIVQAIHALPLVILIVWHAVWTVPGELWETAELSGCGRLSQFVSVFVPLRWPALLAATMIGLATAMSDLGGTILVAPPGVTTLVMRMFDRLHSGADHQIAGIALVLLGGIGCIAAASFAIGRRFVRAPSRTVP